MSSMTSQPSSLSCSFPFHPNQSWPLDIPNGQMPFFFQDSVSGANQNRDFLKVRLIDHLANLYGYVFFFAKIQVAISAGMTQNTASTERSSARGSPPFLALPWCLTAAPLARPCRLWSPWICHLPTRPTRPMGLNKVGGCGKHHGDSYTHKLW